MGILGTLLKTTIHVATSPLDVMSDICTMGGVLTDEGESAVVKKVRKLGRDVRDLEDDVSNL
jgi:hypothetical protein